jgi:hypothetical protein
LEFLKVKVGTMSADGPPGSFDELNKLFAASKASPARKRRANSRVKKNAVALAAAEKAGAALWSPSKELLEDVQLDEEAARDVVGPRRQPDFTADEDEQADADAAAAAGGVYDDDCGGGGGAAEEQWPHAAAPPLLAVSFASPPGAGAGAGGTRVPVISADAQRAVGAAAARSARDVGDAAASAAALRATLREEEQLDAAASAGSLKELKRMIKGGAASRQESPSHKRARTSYREHPDAAEAGQLDAKNPRCR